MPASTPAVLPKALFLPLRMKGERLIAALPGAISRAGSIATLGLVDHSHSAGRYWQPVGCCDPQGADQVQVQPGTVTGVAQRLNNPSGGGAGTNKPWSYWRFGGAKTLSILPKARVKRPW